MPVEIRELVIRAITTLEERNSQASPLVEVSQDDREAIIQECVRQVLRILKKKKER